MGESLAARLWRAMRPAPLMPPAASCREPVAVRQDSEDCPRAYRGPYPDRSLRTLAEVWAEQDSLAGDHPTGGMEPKVNISPVGGDSAARRTP